MYMAEIFNPGIIIKNLSRSFGRLKAVNDVSLSIKQGEIFSLLGPNGAGKTTTIRILCGQLKPGSGTAEIMGHDIIKDTLAAKSIINVSPQETAIARHLNALENLVLIGRI